MLRYLSLLAPLILRAPGSTAKRLSLANLLFAYAFLFFGGVFGMTALYLWASKEFGVVIACLVMCATLLSLGVVMLLARLARKEGSVKKTNLPATLQGDPLAQHIPDSLKDDPRVQQLLEKIAENPLAASASAVALGMLVSRELLGD